MKKILILSTIVASLTFFSCATIKELPEDLTAAQIIQKGQNSVIESNWKNAEYCYQTVIERFGTNPVIFVEAKYELGNVYYKSKRYYEAYNTFNEIIELYDYAGGSLPGAYKKLAQIGLGKIPEKKLQKELAAAAANKAKEDSSL